MKRRFFSVMLALCLVLGLLPTAALAAGESYGPDEEGYAYTVSETSFDLGTVKHDGSGLTKKDVFSYTVTNTGEKPIEVHNGGFGRYETMFGDDSQSNWVTLEPGKSVTFHFDMEVEADAPTRTGEDESFIPTTQTVMLGEKRENYYIYVTVKIVNTSETPEPTPTPSGSSGSGSNSGFNGTDNWGNRYHGVDVGGSSGGNTFVSGGGDTVNLGENLSIREGESYGFTVSPHSLSFDTCFEGEKVDPLYVTLTNTGNTDIDDIYSGFFVGEDYYSPIRFKLVEGKLNSDGELEPGKSVTYELTLNTYQAKSGTETYEGQFLLYSHTAYSFGNGGFGVGKGGHYGKIPGVLTVDYNIRSLSQVAGGDIDWTVDTKSIDFGVSDVVYRGGFHESQEKVVTVTNRGSQTFVLEADVDASACKREDGEYTFHTWDDYQEVKPGETCQVKVNSGSGRKDAGTVEGCKLVLTAYYPDSKEKNTLTTEIPLSIKYLTVGGYEIVNRSDNSYGTVKTSDGIDRGPYSGNSYLTAKEGSSVTFVMTPYDPENYHVTDIKLNGKSVGTSGMVNNTYTISNIRDNYEFEAVFGPITDPALQLPQQPVEQQPVGSAEPAAWAAMFVEQAIEEGLLPFELQNSYDQPISRKDFCWIADRLYFKVLGNFPLTSAEPFTDCDDSHVLSMAAVGVVTGTGGGAFTPDGQLTREQAATILARLADALGKPLPAGEPTFTDKGQIGAWAMAGVGAMEQSGVMNGTGNNQFSPQLSYTKEQSVVTIMRLYEMLK